MYSWDGILAAAISNNQSKAKTLVFQSKRGIYEDDDEVFFSLGDEGNLSDAEWVFNFIEANWGNENSKSPFFLLENVEKIGRIFFAETRKGRLRSRVDDYDLANNKIARNFPTHLPEISAPFDFYFTSVDFFPPLNYVKK